MYAINSGTNEKKLCGTVDVAGEPTETIPCESSEADKVRIELIGEALTLCEVEFEVKDIGKNLHP